MSSVSQKDKDLIMQRFIKFILFDWLSLLIYLININDSALNIKTKMAKIPMKNNFMQIATILAVAAMGVWGFNYYSQKNYSTPKTQVGQRATSDPITKPTIQHAETPGKTISALEQSMNNPSKNASNRAY